VNQEAIDTENSSSNDAGKRYYPGVGDETIIISSIL
jgi:hypothetical protein